MSEWVEKLRAKLAEQPCAWCLTKACAQSPCIVRQRWMARLAEKEREAAQ